MCHFSLSGSVVLYSRVTLAIAVSFAVKRSHFSASFHWPDRLMQQQQ
jgi:hypothetical protein